ncbi:MAG: glycerophosphodiester phosphodiesterase family protein [Bacteroidales bacterium]|nr:glycerophosphodiester phosphodiesterase family protein [Bacteroidales bacterium]
MKRISTILVTIICAISCEDAKITNRAEAIAAQMKDPDTEYVTVACHRGDWRNWPENSVPAIESVIKMGADIVEIDIHMTKDSVLVLCHDNNVLRTTNFKKIFRNEPEKSPKVCDLTLAEIKSLSLQRAHQAAAIDSLHMPTLREALECTKDRICVNIDKGYDYYEQVLSIAEELGVSGQVLIKGSSPIGVVKENEEKHPNNMMYMPVINLRQEKGEALLDSYINQGEVPIAYEICWKNNDDDAFPNACRRIRNQGSKIWVNTIWASLCGGSGNDDDAAYQAEDPGEVYRQYLDQGVSMIQTDRPELLIKWLEKQGRHSLNRQK